MNITDFGIEIGMIWDEEHVEITRYLVQLVGQEDWKGIAENFSEGMVDAVRELIDRLGKDKCLIVGSLLLACSELLFVIVSTCYQKALPARLVQSRLAGAQFLTSIWNVSSLSASTPLTC